MALSIERRLGEAFSVDKDVFEVSAIWPDGTVTISYPAQALSWRVDEAKWVDALPGIRFQIGRRGTSSMCYLRVDAPKDRAIVRWPLAQDAAP